jgi:hypothetical protein
MQENAITMLAKRPTLQHITAMWVTESLGTLTDAEIQELPEFAGVTATEALAAKQAYDAILTTLGDPGTVGTNAYKLLKICNRIP